MAAERDMGSHGQSWKVPLELSSDYGPSRFEFLIHAEADYEINWKSFTKSSSHRRELIFSLCVCMGGGTKRGCSPQDWSVRGGTVPEASRFGTEGVTPCSSCHLLSLSPSLSWCKSQVCDTHQPGLAQTTHRG